MQKVLILLVGARGFEPPTSCSQSRRATGLRYAPTWNIRRLHSALLQQVLQVLFGPSCGRAVSDNYKVCHQPLPITVRPLSKGHYAHS